MTGTADDSLLQMAARLRATISKHSPSPQQAERREREYQRFVVEWCRDPWNAEQARLHGEGWLRACFNSAALAYAGHS